MKIVLVGPRALAIFWRRNFKDTNVEIVDGDIIAAARGGALVSPANSFGWMTGGLDDLIRLAYEADGFDIMAAVRTEIAERHFGEVPVGCAFVLPTPGTRYTHIVVAPTMRTPMPVPLTMNAYLAFRATLLAVRVWNAANCADRVESLCCPGLATGVGKMPPWRAARQMRAAWDAVTEETDLSFVDRFRREVSLRLL